MHFSSGVKRCERATLFGAAVATSLLVAAAPASARAPVRHPPQVLDAGAVAVADEYGAKAAARILGEGGNAVDAAVAMAFSLAVTYPEAGNIGGGGFMTLVVAGKPYFLDYRERAPRAATRNMYLDAKGDVIPGASLVGARAVGVPGTVAGMYAAQKRFGRLSWRQVLEPAIGYARDGFVVSPQLIERRDSVLKSFAGKTDFAKYFGSLQAGQTLRQPALAGTLQRIAAQGQDGFYKGETANLLEAAMRGDHGLITRRDLADYRPVWRTPLTASWDGYRVVTAPPPSSGGIGLVQLLKMKALLQPDFAGVSLNSAQYIHLVAEIEKRVFADRAAYLGDPDFIAVPSARLIDDAYLARRAAEVNPSQISDTAAIKPGLDGAGPAGATGEKPETTHFSVVDKWGNAVSNTYTLNGRFGAGMVVAGAGFLLNDEMDDFSSKPGVANMFGVVGADANAVQPLKRPLSSMTPTILMKDHKVALVIGTPGGSRIFTSVFQVMTDVYDFHMPLDQAVAAMRFHHQLLPPNTIYWEPYQPITGTLAGELQLRGYVLEGQSFNGDIQAIKIDGRVPVAVADPRGRGVAHSIR